MLHVELVVLTELLCVHHHVTKGLHDNFLVGLLLQLHHVQYSLLVLAHATLLQDLPTFFEKCGIVLGPSSHECLLNQVQDLHEVFKLKMLTVRINPIIPGQLFALFSQNFT